MYSANETVRLDALRHLDCVVAAPQDRTSDLARIIRHALKAGAGASPLDRAIRSAVAADGPRPGGDDVELRADFLARRLNAVLAEQDARRETVVA
jgi:hypothetical protein